MTDTRAQHLASIRAASHAANKHYRSLDEEGKEAYRAEKRAKRAVWAKALYHRNRESILARRKELRDKKSVAVSE